jgi:hypothetical protein
MSSIERHADFVKVGFALRARVTLKYARGPGYVNQDVRGISFSSSSLTFC